MISENKVISRLKGDINSYSSNSSTQEDWFVGLGRGVKEMCRRIYYEYVGVGSVGVGSGGLESDLLSVEPSVKTDPGYACSGCVHFDEEVKGCRVYADIPSVGFKASWFPETCPSFRPRGGGCGKG